MVATPFAVLFTLLFVVANSQTCQQFNIGSQVACPAFCFSYPPQGRIVNPEFNQNTSETSLYASFQWSATFAALQLLTNKSCAQYGWRYFCQRTWNSCNKTANTGSSPTQANYDVVKSACGVLFDAYKLYLWLGPMPSSLDASNTTFVDIFPAGVESATYFPSCTSSVYISNGPAGPALGVYEGRADGLRVVMKINEQPLGGFRGTIIFRENTGIVEGFMTGGSNFKIRIYDTDGENPAEPLAIFEGYYINLNNTLVLTDSTLDLTNPNSTSFVPSSLFNIGLQPPAPESLVGKRLPEFQDYVNWVYILGVVLIGFYAVLALSVICYMKTCGSNTQWVDSDIRTGVFLKLRVAVTLAVLLVIASSIAVLLSRINCSDYKILDTSLTFAPCVGQCQNVEVCNSCGGPCCVAVHPDSSTIFAFCAKDLMAWYAMIAPIVVALIAFAATFFFTRASLIF